jgi:hypothetical protein
MKSLFTAIVLLTSFNAFCQDTIHVNKVRVANVLINKKTGMIEKKWFRTVKVKTGYIIKNADGMYVINGREMLPNDFETDSLTVKK